jgi:hypothetical protein
VTGGLPRRDFLLRGGQAATVAALGRLGLGVTTDLFSDRGVLDLGGALRVANVPPPPVVTRAQWGADEALRRAAPSFASVSKLIVHHTVSANDEPDPAGRIRAIYRYHTQANGWSDIGYNFLVDQRGRIYEGRFARAYRRGQAPTGASTSGKGVIGAHAKDHNAGSVGIALLGTYTSAGPTAAAVEALVKLCAWLAERYRIDPMGATPFTNARDERIRFSNIAGHRDVVPTACPGNGAYGLLDHVRRHAALTMADGFVGYRIASSTGRVAHFGGARNYGDLAALGIATRVVGGAAVPSSQGYWLVDVNGAVYSFGGARYRGSIPQLRADGARIGSAAIAGMTATPTGGGYWVFDTTGGVFTFGDARFYGSVPGLPAATRPTGPARVVTMRSTPTGRGYWVLDSAGGVFTFGDARFYGSVPGLRARRVPVGPAAVVDMAPTPTGRGYWVLDANGGVFAFGDARYYGSMPGIGVAEAASGMVPAPNGRGYLVLTRSGALYGFGSVPFYGRWSEPGLVAAALLPVIHR